MINGSGLWRSQDSLIVDSGTYSLGSLTIHNRGRIDVDGQLALRGSTHSVQNTSAMLVNAAGGEIMFESSCLKLSGAIGMDNSGLLQCKGIVDSWMLDSTVQVVNTGSMDVGMKDFFGNLVNHGNFSLRNGRIDTHDAAFTGWTRQNVHRMSTAQGGHQFADSSSPTPGYYDFYGLGNSFYGLTSQNQQREDIGHSIHLARILLYSSALSLENLEDTADISTAQEQSDGSHSGPSQGYRSPGSQETFQADPFTEPLITSTDNFQRRDILTDSSRTEYHRLLAAAVARKLNNQEQEKHRQNASLADENAAAGADSSDSDNDDGLMTPSPIFDPYEEADIVSMMMDSLGDSEDDLFHDEGVFDDFPDIISDDIQHEDYLNVTQEYGFYYYNDELGDMERVENEDAVQICLNLTDGYIYLRNTEDGSWQSTNHTEPSPELLDLYSSNNTAADVVREYLYYSQVDYFRYYHAMQDVMLEMDFDMDLEDDASDSVANASVPFGHDSEGQARDHADPAAAGSMTKADSTGAYEGSSTRRRRLTAGTINGHMYFGSFEPGSSSAPQYSVENTGEMILEHYFTGHHTNTGRLYFRSALANTGKLTLCIQGKTGHYNEHWIHMQGGGSSLIDAPLDFNTCDYYGAGGHGYRRIQFSKNSFVWEAPRVHRDRNWRIYFDSDWASTTQFRLGSSAVDVVLEPSAYVSTASTVHIRGRSVSTGGLDIRNSGSAVDIHSASSADIDGNVYLNDRCSLTIFGLGLIHVTHAVNLYNRDSLIMVGDEVQVGHGIAARTLCTAQLNSSSWVEVGQGLSATGTSIVGIYGHNGRVRVGSAMSVSGTSTVNIASLGDIETSSSEVGQGLTVSGSSVVSIDSASSSNITDSLHVSGRSAITVSSGRNTEVGDGLSVSSGSLLIVHSGENTTVGDALGISSSSALTVRSGGNTTIGAALSVSSSSVLTVRSGGNTTVGAALSVSSSSTLTALSGGSMAVGGRLSTVGSSGLTVDSGRETTLGQDLIASGGSTVHLECAVIRIHGDRLMSTVSSFGYRRALNSQNEELALSASDASTIHMGINDSSSMATGAQSVIDVGGMVDITSSSYVYFIGNITLGGYGVRTCLRSQSNGVVRFGPQSHVLLNGYIDLEGTMINLDEEVALSASPVSDINPLDSARNSSSVWNNDAAGTGNNQGQLVSPAGWMADDSESYPFTCGILGFAETRCSASSQSSGSHTCTKAFDSSGPSEWRTQDEGVGAWIHIHFIDNMTIGSMQFANMCEAEASRSQALTISFSDGSTQHIDNVPNDCSTAIYSLSAVRTSYVNITISAVHDDGRDAAAGSSRGITTGAQRICFFSPDESATSVGGWLENDLSWTANDPSYRSSVHGHSHSPVNALNAYNVRSAWHSGRGRHNQWVAFNFGVNVTLSAVSTTGNPSWSTGYQFRSFAFEAAESLSGPWVSVYSGTGANTVARQTFEFPKYSAACWRLMMHDNHARGDWFSLGAINFYAPEAGADGLVTMRTTRPQPWHEMDAGSVRPIHGVVTQGHAHPWIKHGYVTGYTVQASNDGTNWTRVDNGSVFLGNVDETTFKVNEFDVVVVARYIRIYPEKWCMRITLRAGLFTRGAGSLGISYPQRSQWAEFNPHENRRSWRHHMSMRVGVLLYQSADADEHIHDEVAYHRLAAHLHLESRSTMDLSSSAQTLRWESGKISGGHATAISLETWEIANSDRVYLAGMLGRRVLNPNDSARNSSSVYGDHGAGTGYNRGSLDSPTGWRAKANGRVMLTGNWHSFDGDYGIPTYYLYSSVCMVYGRLPPECRPSYRLIFNLNYNGYTVRVDVQVNGIVAWQAGGNQGSWLSLTGITFATAVDEAADEWHQLDMGFATSIIGIVTQGQADSDEWVTAFRVSVSYNGSSWIDVDDASTYQGNSDRSTKKTTLFSEIVTARYIRIFPTSFYGQIALRAGVLVCAGCIRFPPGHTETNVLFLGGPQSSPHIVIPVDATVKVGGLAVIKGGSSIKLSGALSTFDTLWVNGEVCGDGAWNTNNQLSVESGSYDVGSLTIHNRGRIDVDGQLALRGSTHSVQNTSAMLVNAAGGEIMFESSCLKLSGAIGMDNSGLLQCKGIVDSWMLDNTVQVVNMGSMDVGMKDFFGNLVNHGNFSLRNGRIDTHDAAFTGWIERNSGRYTDDLKQRGSAASVISSSSGAFYGLDGDTFYGLAMDEVHSISPVLLAQGLRIGGLLENSRRGSRKTRRASRRLHTAEKNSAELTSRDQSTVGNSVVDEDTAASSDNTTVSADSSDSDNDDGLMTPSPIFDPYEEADIVSMMMDSLGDSEDDLFHDEGVFDDFPDIISDDIQHEDYLNVTQQYGFYYYNDELGDMERVENEDAVQICLNLTDGYIYLRNTEDGSWQSTNHTEPSPELLDLYSSNNTAADVVREYLYYSQVDYFRYYHAMQDVMLEMDFDMDLEDDASDSVANASVPFGHDSEGQARDHADPAAAGSMTKADSTGAYEGSSTRRRRLTAGTINGHMYFGSFEPGSSSAPQYSVENTGEMILEHYFTGHHTNTGRMYFRSALANTGKLTLCIQGKTGHYNEHWIHMQGGGSSLIDAPLDFNTCDYYGAGGHGYRRTQFSKNSFVWEAPRVHRDRNWRIYFDSDWASTTQFRLGSSAVDVVLEPSAYVSTASTVHIRGRSVSTGGLDIRNSGSAVDIHSASSADIDGNVYLNDRCSLTIFGLGLIHVTHAVNLYNRDSLIMVGDEVQVGHGIAARTLCTAQLNSSSWVEVGQGLSATGTSIVGIYGHNGRVRVGSAMSVSGTSTVNIASLGDIETSSSEVGQGLTVSGSSVVSIDSASSSNVTDSLHVSGRSAITVSSGRNTEVGDGLSVSSGSLLTVHSGENTTVGDALGISSSSALTVRSGGNTTIGAALSVSSSSVLTVRSGGNTTVGAALSVSSSSTLTALSGGSMAVGGRLSTVGSSGLTVDSGRETTLGQDLIASGGSTVHLECAVIRIHGDRLMSTVSSFGYRRALNSQNEELALSASDASTIHMGINDSSSMATGAQSVIDVGGMVDITSSSYVYFIGNITLGGYGVRTCLRSQSNGVVRFGPQSHVLLNGYIDLEGTMINLDEEVALSASPVSDINPLDSARNSSSVWNNDAAGTGNNQGQLVSPAGWMADDSESYPFTCGILGFAETRCSASSQSSGSHTCTKAFDSSGPSEWRTQDEGVGAWIHIHFIDNMTIGSMQFANMCEAEASRSQALTISFSDGSTQHIDNVPNDCSTAIYSLSAVRTSYVNITISAVHDDGRDAAAGSSRGITTGAQRICFFSPDESATSVGGWLENDLSWTANDPSYRSSVHGHSHSPVNALNAYNVRSAWHSGRGRHNQWVAFNFGVNVTLSAVSTTGNPSWSTGYQFRSFAFEAAESLSGPWVSVYSGTGANTVARQTFEFPKYSAACWRLMMHDNHARGDWFSLGAINFYAPEAGADGLVTMRTTRPQPWHEMDAGSVRPIHGVVTQGHAHPWIKHGYVTGYTVQASNDGTNWTRVDNGSVFLGNVDETTFKVNEFDVVVVARYIRIYPEKWCMRITLRAGLFTRGAGSLGISYPQRSQWAEFNPHENRRRRAVAVSWCVQVVPSFSSAREGDNELQAPPTLCFPGGWGIAGSTSPAATCTGSGVDPASPDFACQLPPPPTTEEQSVGSPGGRFQGESAFLGIGEIPGGDSRESAFLGIGEWALHPVEGGGLVVETLVEEAVQRARGMGVAEAATVLPAEGVRATNIHYGEVAGRVAYYDDGGRRGYVQGVPQSGGQCPVCLGTFLVGQVFLMWLCGHPDHQWVVAHDGDPPPGVVAHEDGDPPPGVVDPAFRTPVCSERTAPHPVRMAHHYLRRAHWTDEYPRWDGSHGVVRERSRGADADVNADRAQRREHLVDPERLMSGVISLVKEGQLGKRIRRPDPGVVASLEPATPEALTRVVAPEWGGVDTPV
ncbi:hypothetical protein CYMTET_11394 [Cymbomonas tetramitiformis]|uniref:F5/8 type C domain-containing protein n=1 Tax=Cymbomonas tetramitiformis TaxID=36881 RepID=A0AAE0GM70_9CHLO|nr:hypothetical protein CYMTET_11394 [Cymbomonas tetramitiformis]